MTAAVATLVVGVVVGYMAQRSRMCFVGGIRDFMLIRDTRLLMGLVAFGLVAWVGFPIAGLLVGERALPQFPQDAMSTGITVLGAVGVGYTSVLANGCPLRQHVLAAQGVKSSVAYLVGFFAGAIAFHAWTEPVLLRLLP